MKKVIGLLVVLLVFGSFLTLSPVTAAPKTRILWFAAYYRGAGFIGGITAPQPNLTVFDNYPDLEVHVVTQVSGLPSDWYEYDVLVISDTGFPENLSEFRGELVVTIDSGISTFFYWFTGDNQYYQLWDYRTHSRMTWVNPPNGNESVSGGDARIYRQEIEKLGWISPRLDVIYAMDDNDPDMISVGLFEVNFGETSFYWLHMGPYDTWHPDTPNGQTILVAQSTEKVLALERVEKVTNSMLMMARLTFYYYHQYQKLSEEFDALHEMALNESVDNETLMEAEHYRKLADEEYQQAMSYGPIFRNLGNIRAFIHLRKAVVSVKHAILILKDALE